jgi:hypothetical protein
MPELPPSPDRRTVLASSAAAGAVGLLGLHQANAAEIKSTHEEHKMATDGAIRPFHYKASNEELLSEETRCGDQVADGNRWRTTGAYSSRRCEARALLGDGRDWRNAKRDQRAAELCHRDRQSRHSFHSRSLEARTCAADHHHPGWPGRSSSR